MASFLVMAVGRCSGRAATYTPNTTSARPPPTSASAPSVWTGRLSAKRLAATFQASCRLSSVCVMTVEDRSLPLGADLLAAGRFHDALAPLRQALSLGDTAPSTLLNLAIAEDHAGDRDRAR